MEKLKIIVCGATGNQGGAVARALLADGRYQVVGLTRDPGCLEAEILCDLGAEIIGGDTTSKTSLALAFNNAYGVFGITQPWSAEDKSFNIRNELIQAKNIIWACREAGINHLVFSSFMNHSCLPTGVSFIDSKLEIERLIQNSGVPYTILRCAFYMENITLLPGRNVLLANYRPDTAIPYVALSDIGRGAMLVFNELSRFKYLTVELIADYATGKQLTELLSGLNTGKKFIYKVRFPLLLKFLKPDIYKLRRFLMNQNEYQLLISTFEMRELFSDLGYIPLKINEYLIFGGHPANGRSAEI
jgi:uncharacterized protein YbjT (DUF2867 family)